jgi:polysaccharide biosynthesis/export protein
VKQYRIGGAPKRLSWLPFALLLAVSPAAATAATVDGQVSGGGLPAPSAQPTEYRIGPLDTLSITVFEVKDLSLEKIQVDASGQLDFPLIGQVLAQGKTAHELAGEIARRLDATYMHDPQVAVAVVESQSQKITVEGAVTEAGVFQVRGSSTLLQAIALARGPGKTADLSHVTLFRTVGGTRQQYSYNAKAIQSGRENDPEVLAGDLIVVGESRGKSTLQNIGDMAPLLYLLSVLHP